MQDKPTKHSLSVKVAEQINDLIIRDKLKPGTKLPNEAQLAEMCGVSRPTVREAMKMLKAQNIIVIRQGDGTYVCDFTGLGDDPLGFRYIDRAKLTESVFEVRLIIEPQIAALAVERATPEKIQQMEQIVQKMYTINYRDPARLELDIQFHTLIAKCSKNAVFNQVIPVIYETIQKGIVILAESEESFSLSQHMHNDIFQAFVHRDSCRAQNAVTTHIYTSLDNIRRLKKGKA